jgi:pimeloyl-ACP methyl ester carboxylesterase
MGSLYYLSLLQVEFGTEPSFGGINRLYGLDDYQSLSIRGSLGVKLDFSIKRAQDDSCPNREGRMAIQPRSGHVASNGIRVFYDAFGDMKDPAVLLIIGMDEQCTGWLPYIYEPIVEAGFYVVRFDNRDCGLSEWIEDWDENHPYSLEDMAGDAVGLLDALGIREAHIVGASMGGMIAQTIAIRHPDRVRTLTSIASSAFPLDPDPEVQPSINVAKFQAIHEELVASYPNHLTVPAETIEFRLGAARAFSGSRFPFDEAFQREAMISNIIDRKGFNPQAQTHQLAAVLGSGSRLEELESVSSPTLILHGTEDPLVPPGHGAKCAAHIPGAKLVWMEGVGHELPPGIMPQVHKELLSLFSKTNVLAQPSIPAKAGTP